MTRDLISVDDHIIEHADVWTDRLPRKHQADGPHVIEEDSRQFWVYEGRRGATMGLNAVAGKPRDQWNMEPARFDDMIPGCYDPVQRARDLESDGIRASLCFPTFPKFAGVTFLRADDKQLADLCVKAYNDFILEEWCASVPGMYIPMVIGQLWDPELLAAEVRRCADKGARALSFPENPALLGLPSFHTEHWDPVWRAVTETDTVVCMHIGTSGVQPKTADDASFTVTIALAPVNAQLACTDLLMSGIPSRFPAIKFALSEGGIGWVPFALERVDRVWEFHRQWADLGDLRPSDAFRRNVWVCFIDERAGIDARHHIGVDRIMWECDYPHADTPWPHSQKVVAEALEGVPEGEAERMVHGNAEELFRWPIDGEEV